MNAFVRALGFVVLLCSIAAPAGADTMMPGMMMAQPVTSRTAGPYRIVLGFMPAEPFYTAGQVEARHIKEGMLVVGGAAPVQPGAESHPNHHLVFHVYDATSGKALTGAHVSIAYRRSGGAAVPLPVVEMQVIGKGPESTHYGNNVTLPPGTYDVKVTVNGSHSATFSVKSRDSLI
jgi:hypothetical protein